MSNELKFPMHEKLKLVQPHSQHIHEFIDWLRSKHEIVLASQYTDSKGEKLTARVQGESIPALGESTKNITRLVAEYFGIDENELENEKRAMLAELQKHNIREVKTK